MTLILNYNVVFGHPRTAKWTCLLIVHNYFFPYLFIHCFTKYLLCQAWVQEEFEFRRCCKLSARMNKKIKEAVRKPAHGDVDVLKRFCTVMANCSC